MKKRGIELLAPARNLSTGIEAIRHGADAVYIGASAFGARAAAGNSLEDIAQLTAYAHLFHARVYVTLNTILTDEELSEAQKLIEQLYQVGVDALIVQDMALLRLKLPPIDLHASTQMDNCDAAKVKFLEDAGFSQVVLARELSLSEMATIRSRTSCALEAFVHGALCVSYSGRCYASQHCFARSANRGECAQFCRLPFTLIDGNGKAALKEKHLLSLCDMNRSGHLESMLDAGISSFKIEGRLKDETYVKNVTAAYRQALDEIISRRSEDFERTSHGTSTFTFTPNLQKSFNRGFTDYFLRGERSPMHNFATPKSKGEYLGQVTSIGKRHLETNITAKINAGDGFTYLDTEGKLCGFRANRAEGSNIFPAIMPRIRVGTALYRNADAAFSKLLAKPSAERKISIDIELRESPHGFVLSAKDESGCSTSLHFPFEKSVARSLQEENIRTQLSRLGDTIFSVRKLNITFVSKPFIPSSVLTTWRRDLIEKLICTRRIARPLLLRKPENLQSTFPRPTLDYTANVANSQAEIFYESHGANIEEKAFELKEPSGVALMYTKYCLREALGCCLQKGGGKRLPEPLILRLSDGRDFKLKFDCNNCGMRIYAKK